MDVITAEHSAGTIADRKIGYVCDGYIGILQGVILG
jgi:hypothetical protein